MKRVLVGLLFLALTLRVYAENSIGYVTIKEVKAWDSKIDVYMTDNQEHQCSETIHKTRFLADAAKAHHVSFLLTAFTAAKAVRLEYRCQSDGTPLITGIRMK